MIAGTSPCHGICSEKVMPINSKVSFGPMLPYSLATATGQLTLVQA